MNASKNVPTLCSILALVASAGVVNAQGVYAGGFLHTPIGAATIESSSDRKLVANNIGSSGQDGVEVKWRTSHGGSVGIDMNALSATPQNPTLLEILCTSISGTPRVKFTAVGNFADGVIQESCDFSALGPPASLQVEVTCTSSTGVVTVLPPFDGPIVTWTTEVAYGPGEQATWTYSAGKVSISSFNCMKRSAPRSAAHTTFPSTTGGVIDVPDVVSVSCRPICIVAPCPGDWTDLGSMFVTGTGMGAGKATFKEFTVIKRAPCSSCGPGAPPDGEIQVRGTGGAILEESLTTDIDDDGIPDDVIICNNLGSSGQDGVSIDLPSSPSWHGIRGRWGNGHVTLMKITDDEGSEMRVTSVKDDLACTTTLTPDFTSFDSSGVVVECRDQFDNPIASQTLTPGQFISCAPACGFVTFEAATASASGCCNYMKIEWDDAMVPTFPTGLTVPGTTSIVVRPFTATATFSDLSRVSLTSGDGEIVLGLLELFSPDAPICPANLDDGTGTGTPDAGVDINDLLYFLAHFELGC